ncbi:M48 metallopeptidase family protein [Aeromicrobium senzhongii]|nr:M48 family metallopeptidase [Aeromicrobium senzhongii]
MTVVPALGHAAARRAIYRGAMAEIEVRRSARRTRTVSARREGGRTIVMIPASMNEREERRAVAEMVARLDARDRRRSVARSDTALEERAARLAALYVPEAPAPASVRWVTNQNTRWGSCTPVDRTIRLSHRLHDMPDHVVDAVLVHELAHLVVSGHGRDFEAIVRRFHRMDEAMGFLEGVTWQQRRDS